MDTFPVRSPVRPIFLLGVLGRSGTNYLSDLLRLHPAAELPSPIWEDHLLRFAHHLVRYVDELEDLFRGSYPQWEVDPFLRPAMTTALGNGLLDVLAWRAGDGVRPLTKTPSVENLDRFFDFFPGAHLLIVVRDGRATVESLVRSFDWPYEHAMHAWGDSAAAVVDFDRRMRGSGAPYRIVRYEDLLADLDGQLRSVLEFVDLDPGAYDFDAAASLPVRGSSTLRADAEQAVHWEPVDKAEGFNPLDRAEQWPSARHDRFEWIAGEQLRALGYDVEGGRSGSAWRSVRHAARDAVWRGEAQATRLKRRVGRRSRRRDTAEPAGS